MAKWPVPSFIALRPHAETLCDAGCGLQKSIRSVLFLFFFTCPVWVSAALLSAGCQRVDPNIPRSNLLEIRLNVGWIILSDLLIWQFVLTNHLEQGARTSSSHVFFFFDTWWAVWCVQMVGWAAKWEPSNDEVGVSVSYSWWLKSPWGDWKRQCNPVFLVTLTHD